MNLIIRAAKIVDPNSPYNGKKADILIKNGRIQEIGKKIQKKGVKTFEAGNLHVSPGWFDMQAHFTDPGHEYKEDIDSGLAAAAMGGFTAVLAMPSTQPVVDNKSAVEYLINKSRGNAVKLFPTGTLSKGMKGKDISEMYDMHRAGAVAFTDDKKSVRDAALQIRAMLYVRSFEGLIISFPEDMSLTENGQINEGKTSTVLGLKGMPSLAENLSVTRDIYLAEYCNSKLHFSLVSSEESVELIKKSKKKNNKISCGVCAHNLFFEESSLEEYDTNLKINPPLRTKKDVKGLIKGLKNGSIDVICSDHRPQDIEEKKREFDHAAFGALGLQTAFAASRTATINSIDLQNLIEKISINPRSILNLPIPSIKEGSEAELTLFDPDLSWELTENQIRSKSKNSPYIGKKLTGKPLGIFSNNKFVKVEN